MAQEYRRSTVGVHLLDCSAYLGWYYCGPCGFYKRFFQGTAVFELRDQTNDRRRSQILDTGKTTTVAVLDSVCEVLMSRLQIKMTENFILCHFRLYKSDRLKSHRRTQDHKPIIGQQAFRTLQTGSAVDQVIQTHAGKHIQGVVS